MAPLPNPRDPAWQAALPRHAGDAMRRDLRLRLRYQADIAESLLLPLAYAQGGGLPWENIWPRLAEALSPGNGYGNDHLVWLRRTAGSYAVEGVADGRSAYRLFHQALAEYLLERRDRRGDQQAITEALITLVPRRAGGSRDWAAAHPYIRTHLATHAAQAGFIDDLLTDPAYLLNAGRPQLLASLGAALSPSARSAADAYRQASRHLRSKPASEHASYLQLAARCGRAPDLADNLENHRQPNTWSSKWASWQPEPPHDSLIGHTGTVSSVAVGELDGHPVAVSGGFDASVRVWDLASGAPAGAFTGHTDWVRAVAVTKVEGQPIVISGGDDCLVRAWDLTSGTLAGSFPGHDGAIFALAAAELDDRSVVVSAGHDGAIRVWDLTTGTLVGNFPGHDGAIFALAAGELDGRPVVVSAGHDSAIRVWDLTTGTLAGDPFRGHTDWVRTVAITELGGRKVVVSGGDDQWLQIWDLTSGASVQTWRLPGSAPHSDPGARLTSSVLALAAGWPAGRPVVVSAGRDNLARVWDLASGTPTGNPFTGHTNSVRAVAITELDGRPVVISGGSDMTVRIWDLASDTLPAGGPFAGHTGQVHAVAIGQLEGRQVAVSGGSDRSIRAWDLVSGLPVGGSFSEFGEVRAVAIGQVEGRPVVLSDGGFSLRQSELASLSSEPELRMDPDRRKSPPPLATKRRVSRRPSSTEERRPPSSSWPSPFWLRASRSVGNPPSPPGVPSRPLIHPQDLPPRALQSWQKRAAQPPQRPQTLSGEPGANLPPWPRSWPRDMQETPTRIFPEPSPGAGSPPPERPRSPAPRRPPETPAPSVQSWVGPFHPHSRRKEIIPPPQPVRLRTNSPSSFPDPDPEDLLPRAPSQGKQRPGAIFALAAEQLYGRPIAVSGAGNGSVCVWDLDSGASIGDPFIGHSGTVRTVLFADLGGRSVVISGGDDGSVRLWDLAKRRAVRYRMRPLRLDHISPVHCALVRYSYERLAVVTGCEDGTTWTWDVDSARPLSKAVVPGGSGISAMVPLQPDQILYANGRMLSLYA